MAETRILPIFVGKFYEVSKRVLPRYAHPRGSHRYTFARLATSLSLKIYYHLTYREIENILSQAMELRVAMELSRVPDHSTLCRAMEMLGPYISRIDNGLKEELQLKGSLIAYDGTGLREEQASVYYQRRRGGKYRQWRKLVLAVGRERQFILASAVGKGPGSDAGYFKPLKQQSRRWREPEGTLPVADKGFDGKSVAAGDIVPPIRRGRRKERY